MTTKRTLKGLMEIKAEGLSVGFNPRLPQQGRFNSEGVQLRSLMQRKDTKFTGMW